MCCTGAAAPALEQLLHVLQQSCSVLCGNSYSMCSSGAAASAPIQLMLHVLSVLRGNSCSICSSGAAVSAPRKLLLWQSCSLCSWEAAASGAPFSCFCSQRAAVPRASAELLFVLWGSRCSMCFSGAVVRAPRKCCSAVCIVDGQTPSKFRYTLINNF